MTVLPSHRLVTKPKQQGMTLLEIMIVLAIVGMLMLILVGNVFRSQRTRVREASVEVEATLKLAYSMSAMKAKHHRVVFDLDKHQYHLEVCEGPVSLEQSDEEKVLDPDDYKQLLEKLESAREGDIDQQIVSAGSPEEAVAAAAALEGVSLAGTRCKPQMLTLGGRPSKSKNQHVLEFDRKITVRKIYVQHLNDPVEEGIVTINFFPNGSAEKAVVIVGDDEMQNTIVLHGLTSRVEFYSDEFDAEDHMMRNAVGDRNKER